MSDNTLDRIPLYDRVSLRAVLVPDGVDPGPALAQAGITEPIVVPIRFGEKPPDAAFGDGFTPNLTAVLDYDRPDGSAGAANDRGDRPDDPAISRRGGRAGVDPGPRDASQAPAVPPTVNLPAAYGLQPLAPVRSPGRLAQPARTTPPNPSGFVQPDLVSQGGELNQQASMDDD